MFSIFKHTQKVPEKAVQAAPVHMHDESTQRFSVKPDLKFLEQGLIQCQGCRRELRLTDDIPLAMCRCPFCETPYFNPKFIKDFWLYEPLGGGGMGSVYHAFHIRNTNVEFAVKLLPREKKSDASLINSLLDEAHNGKKFCGHPHIANVFDYGFHEGEYYAVYEFIDGIRLDQIIDSPARRPYKQIALWALQILSAEQHMYDCGFLYRDLKPQNIIIDRNGNAKIIDFGLAITLEEAGKSCDEIQGSPFYIPPERITGSGEGQYSEIYSLGMVIYHVIAKQTYYSSSDIRELIGKHVISLRINNIAGKLPAKTHPEIIKILNRMIDRNPNLRYQTYKDAASDLFKFYKELAA